VRTDCTREKRARKQPVRGVTVFTTRELVDRSTGFQRFRTTLLAAFAGLALCLAVIGVYGVMAYYVAERAREIGIREALGATPGEVRSLVIRRGMLAAALGVALGMVVAVAATRVLSTLLFGVEPLDAGAFTIAPVVLLATALIASYLPARRATRVNPLVAMRDE
jgi:putative ABC transport system permease protein